MSFRTPVWLFALVAGSLLGPGVCYAQSPTTTTTLPSWCQRDATVTDAAYNPQNIILYVLDDTSAAVFPAFAAPVEWPNQDSPPGVTTETRADVLSMRYEAERRRPDLNRFAARVHADGNALGHVVRNDPTSALVVPIDLTTTSATGFTYTEDDAGAGGILPNHGGVGRLMSEGVVFPRMYATSALCSPTRSAIMTGRHPKQVGVAANKLDLDEKEVTWAEILKTTCTDAPEAKTACYRTGFLGKWHLGNKTSDGARQALWTRGFDEALYDTQNSRWHWAKTPLRCNPARSPDPLATAPGFFCTDSTIEVKTCSTDSKCTGTYTTSDKCDAPGACACTVVPQASGGTTQAVGHCYQTKPTASCDPTLASQCSTPTGSLCRRWGTYVGPVAGRTVCHPDDDRNPLCCSAVGGDKSTRARDGSYAFGRKLVERAATSDVPLPPGVPLFSTNKSAPCNDSDDRFFDRTGGSDEATKACLYDIRYQRDFARNFIVRNSHGRKTRAQEITDEETGERFALYIATHATHIDRGAPERTISHYTTLGEGKGLKATLPTQAKQFWASLEEVDAAIGSILATVAGFCDTTAPAENPSQVPNYGKACTSNGECTGGKCNTALANQTVVMLTADQGLDESSFGQPWLRDGKGSVYDGGIRVGLQVWGPGIGIGGPASATDRRVTGELASHVDLAPTILEAAGCKSASPAVPGVFTIAVCNDKTRRFCSGTVLCDGTTQCVQRTLEGSSLLPSLRKTLVPNQHTRDVVFAEFEANSMITARQGYLFDPVVGACGPNDSACQDRADARWVCGYRKSKPAVPDIDTTTVYEGAIGRERDGGSCEVCTSDAECGSVPCEIDGRFCVSGDDSPANPCLDQSLGTVCGLPTGLARCGGASGSECPDVGMKCMTLPVRVACNTCLPASWKLKRPNGALATSSDVELFDVSTNTEERASLDCEPGSRVPESKLGAVREALSTKLNAWVDCTKNNTVANNVQVRCEVP